MLHNIILKEILDRLDALAEQVSRVEAAVVTIEKVLMVGPEEEIGKELPEDEPDEQQPEEEEPSHVE